MFGIYEIRSREECSMAFKNTEVLELLRNANGCMAEIPNIKFLCNLDEIVAVISPPERSYVFFSSYQIRIPLKDMHYLSA